LTFEKKWIIFIDTGVYMFSLFILSFIQSVTEFLPVSSSGHLYLLQFLGISEQGMGMDVLLHLGTLLAVICYFWSDIRSLLITLSSNKEQLLQIHKSLRTQIKEETSWDDDFSALKTEIDAFFSC
jgi:undecaprenyl pyrophosphate phosphatase UppP